MGQKKIYHLGKLSNQHTNTTLLELSLFGVCKVYRSHLLQIISQFRKIPGYNFKHFKEKRIEPLVLENMNYFLLLYNRCVFKKV